jgi:hypothetical protein
MKQLGRAFLLMFALFYFETNSLHAQLFTAVNLLAHGATALSGSGNSHQTKQEKIVDQSTGQQKIAGSNVMTLRVKENEIKSKAKAHIVALQNRLDEYNAAYKSNAPLNIPKNDSDLIAIQNMDENWPTEYYANELKAYKRYAFQQKQKIPSAPADSLHAPQNSLLKKDSTAGKL